MSLQVWLPLNGNLLNKGLNDTNITNNGATVDNSGKIGKCYTFNGTSSYITLNNLTCAGWSEFSLSCWCYPTADFTALFLIRGASAHRIKVNADGFTFRDNNNSSQRTTSFGTTIPLNTWSYITCVYNRGEVFMYVNGVLTNHSTTYYHADSQFLSDHNETRIGRQQSSSSNVYYTGKINDFRIYDHALSLKEVKEISKGLIIHYPLDNNGLGHPNLILDSYYTIDPWASAISQRNIEFKSKTSMIYQVRTLYTKTGSGANSIFPSITFKENTIYTLSGYYNDTYRTDGKGSNPVFRFEYDDGTRTTVSPHAWAADENGWKYFEKTSTEGKNVTSITCSYGNSGYCALAYLKLEEDAVATKFTPGSNLNIIYDTSGYLNNKTPTNLSYSTDTIKYQACANFDGDTSVISLGNISSLLQNLFTVNLWFKKSELGSKNYETLFGGPSGFEMDTRAGSSTTLSLYMASTRGGNVFSPFNLNQWYMITMVNDGTNELYYINGELKKTIAKKSMPSGNYFIGSWSSATSQNYKGLISDFRIYATPLNTEDILELYHTSALADRNNNFYTYLYNLLGYNNLIEYFYNFVPYSNGVIVYNQLLDGLHFLGYGGAKQDYIPIDPTNKTFKYDIIYSNTIGNMFYIGWERYDADKTSRSNNACVYAISSKPTSDILYQRARGTINLSTDGVNPCAFIRLRILNNWTNSTSDTEGKAIIHSLSLKEYYTEQEFTPVNISRQNVTSATALLEKNNMNININRSQLIDSNQFYEI